MICKHCKEDLSLLPPEANIHRHLWAHCIKTPTAPTEMASLREIKQRLAAIEQDINVLKGVGQELLSGQDKLLQSHGALAEEQRKFSLAVDFVAKTNRDQWESWFKPLEQSIEQIKGALLHQQFKENEPVVIQGIKEFVEAYEDSDKADRLKEQPKSKRRRK